MRKPMLILPLSLVLGACSLTPEYVRPDVNAPGVWSQANHDTTQAETAQWWKQFGDPVLDQLITTALAENKDMKIAVSRIEEARAQLGITEAQNLPQVSAQLGSQKSMSSDQIYGKLPIPRKSETDQLVLGASYEVDLWGKLRNASAAAREKLFASAYNREALRISLVSQVATGYFHLRTLDRQLEISRINLATQKETEKLTLKRFEGGIASAYDYSQAKAQTALTETSLPELERQIILQQNALSILLGRSPGPIPRGRKITELTQDITVPAGLPSQLLERRPDVLAAEAQLRAANANIGSARAAFLPRISLTASGGYESHDLHALSDPGAAMWNLAAGLTQPIFAGGALKNQLRQAEASQREMVATYQKTAQTAFREAEDGFANLRLTRAQTDGKQARAASLAAALRIAKLRYNEGLNSFMDLLDAERTQLQAELDVATQLNQQLSATVNLFAALGGGWDAEPARKEIDAAR
ncbi:efflux transporter outer membrane subunit [Niveibacterium terrae]|uniref:efflux transporter outer membrane subunit n=1 Tax=Niveibacterium terrae TaxID=3373598 RepID=UPI003A910765